MKSLKEKLINLSMFYKILVTNTLIIVVGAVIGTWLTGELSQRSAPEQLIYIFVLMGVILSISVNFLIIKAALQPLANLQNTVEAVYRGDLTARAARTPLDDPIITRLREALNSMLEELSTSQKRLEELSSRILSAQEEERKRVARELHDSIAQALIALLHQLENWLHDKTELPVAEARELWVFHERIKDVLQEVRHIGRDLRPSILDDVGLLAALRWVTRELKTENGVEASLHVRGTQRRFSQEAELTLFRIVQEALRNVGRHSQASQAEVSIRFEEGKTVVIITDNGIGFQLPGKVSDLSRSGKLGLAGMQERVRLLNGNLEIKSEPDKGTTIIVEAPI